MGFVKRLVVVIISLMIFTGIYTEAQGQTLSGRTMIVGTKEVPPFAMKNSDGTWTGVSIDLWRQIAGELNLPFEFRERDLKGTDQSRFAGKDPGARMAGESSSLSGKLF